MELKLDIYNGKVIEKTYVSNDFALMTGTCEDILKLIDIEKIGDLDDDTSIMEVVKIVLNAFQEFNPLMKQIFEGLTDDEYRRTHIVDVARVVIDVLKYTLKELFTASSKN